MWRLLAMNITLSWVSYEWEMYLEQTVILTHGTPTGIQPNQSIKRTIDWLSTIILAHNPQIKQAINKPVYLSV